MRSINFKADKEKQMLYGPFLIPDMLIYRRDDVNGEYYVRFSKEEIEKIATKFNRNLNNKNINLMHTDQQVEAFVAQNWVIESSQDKSQSLGFDLPEGTWFGGVKIVDTDFWSDKVKNDEVKGFSVEILADLQLALQKINKIDMQKENINLANVMKTDGTPVYYDGTEVAVGTALFMDEAMTEPAPDGEHELEGGLKIIVSNGLVAQIMEVEESIDATEELADPMMPAEGGSISMDQVQEMINARFTELNDEITSLKKEIETMKGSTEQKMSNIEEKLANTPAAVSITAKDQPKAKLISEFEEALSRVKSFSKQN